MPTNKLFDDTMNFTCPHCNKYFQSKDYIKNRDYEDNYYTEHILKCYKSNNT